MYQNKCWLPSVKILAVGKRDNRPVLSDKKLFVYLIFFFNYLETKMMVFFFNTVEAGEATIDVLSI